MYQLLKRLGFDRVMNWPMFESIPAPLSETDAQALRDYRRTIDDAHAAGLEFWLAQTANLTPPPSIAAKPWKERNSYPVWKHVRLDDPAAAAASKQPLIPWVWCGWGTEKVWGGNPNTPPEQIAPFVRASLETLAAGMPEPPERSNRENWANGRVNVALAEETGLMPRSTLFLYEAIEYEPSIPGSNLQFADIRRMLRDEAAAKSLAASGTLGAEEAAKRLAEVMPTPTSPLR